MSLNREEIVLKEKDELKQVKENLHNSSIYVDIMKIIDAYNKSLVIEKDDIFCVQDPTNKDEKKFSVTKYIEARKVYDSGELQSKIDEIDKRLRYHKYLIAKNRDKDKYNYDYLVSKKDKISNCACLIDTKKEWNNIINEEFPDRDRASYVYSLAHYIDTYKDLSNSMEKTCFRHKDDVKFVSQLNDLIEADLHNLDKYPEEGREIYQSAMKNRGKFIGALERYKGKYLQDVSDLSSEQDIKWF